MEQLIPYDRSVIVAADVPDMASCRALTEAVKGVPRIGGFKIGIEVGADGLAMAAYTVKEAYGESIVLIYDHQKAGNDIPEMGMKFARKVREAGFDAAILFPFAGPATQEVWTKSCQDKGLCVLIGGVMTHPKFLVSEGGYIDNAAPEQIFRLACTHGVRDFVVPGNKLEWVIQLRALLVNELGESNFVLYAPGFISQGGDVTECGKAAGARFHAIVGSAIYGKGEFATPGEMREAALRVMNQLAA